MSISLKIDHNEEPESPLQAQLSISGPPCYSTNNNNWMCLRDLGLAQKISFKMENNNRQTHLIGDGNADNDVIGAQNKNIEEKDHKSNAGQQNQNAKHQDIEDFNDDQRLNNPQMPAINNEERKQDEENQEIQISDPLNNQQQRQDQFFIDVDFKTYIQGMKNTSILAMIRGVVFSLIYTAILIYSFHGHHKIMSVVLIAPFLFVSFIDILIMVVYYYKILHMQRNQIMVLYPKCCTSQFIIFFILGALNFVSLIVYYAMNISFTEELSLNLSLTVVLVGFSQIFCLLFLRLFIYAFWVLPLLVIWLVYLIFVSLFVGFMMMIKCKGFKPAKCQNFYQRQRVTDNTNKIKELKQNCPVCLQILNNGENIMDLQCLKKNHHYFHQQCAKKWLKKHKTCPNCRKDYRLELERKNNIWMKGFLYRSISLET